MLLLPAKSIPIFYVSVTPPGKEKEIIKKIPVGRLGNPRDVAEAVLFSPGKKRVLSPDKFW
jgi:NAD(P)-dependent dehydrogenase (short-subunit alcohol dehydrogenase family)